jgi:hypothetical protein
MRAARIIISLCGGDGDTFTRQIADVHLLIHRNYVVYFNRQVCMCARIIIQHSLHFEECNENFYVRSKRAAVMNNSFLLPQLMSYLG